MGHLMTLRDVVPDLPVVFTHVPKTGGSTITSGMAMIVGRDNIAGISIAPPEKRREFLQRTREEGRRYVYGHFRYPDTEGIYDQANFVMALRHPLDRILSFYFAILRADPRSTIAQKCATDLPGAGFALFHDRLIQHRQQDNLMCRYLCSEPDHQLAIKTLQERYCLVWDNEGADLAWRKLYRQLRGKDPPMRTLRRRNHAPMATSSDDFASGARPKSYSTFLPPENMERVAELNREDYLLFDWFRNNSAEEAPSEAREDSPDSSATAAVASR